jgi:hypothetical protein
MKFHPILFSTEMVKAILEGTKTQTRRIVKAKGCKPFPMPTHWDEEALKTWTKDYHPYGNVGDVLWVRESFAYAGMKIRYKSDGDWRKDEIEDGEKSPWKPSIHMPKTACRLFLKIKSIRVERLQDINESEAVAEGVLEFEDGTYKNYFTQKGLRAEDGVECLLGKGSFQSLWCSINGIDSWKNNPWVWVIEFKRIEKPSSFLP